MEYTLQNDTLLVKVAPLGAELARVLHKPSDTELLWQGDAAVWAGRAPLLFPWCGSLYNNTLYTKDTAISGLPKHGFARTSLFTLVGQDENGLRLRLESSEEILQQYPWPFCLEVVYSLDGGTLRQRVEVTNTGERVLPCNVGFHPAFCLPLGEEREPAGYEVRFEVPESPLELKTPGGLVSGEVVRYGTGLAAIELTDDLFAQDSLCFTGLASKHITLAAKGGGKHRVRVGIEGFPYVLLWGPAKGPLPFVCIEPWHGVPDPTRPYGAFENKPGVTLVKPKDCFTTTLTVEFSA